MGPALPPEVAVAVARGIIATLHDGPYDTPPARRIDPDMVEIATNAAGSLRVGFGGDASLGAVGELLYVMLAGGPLHVRKDAPGARPRPLAKLRAFLGGGAMPERLEPFVTELIEERFASVDGALDALDALEID